MNEHVLSPRAASAEINVSDPAVQPPAAPRRTTLPISVLIVAIINIAFIGLLALESSDSYFVRGGRIARSLYVLPVAILLLYGVLNRRRWAWWATRAVAALGAAIYAGAAVGVWVFSSHLQLGLRVWISTVSASLFMLVLSAFFALGRRPARDFFRG
jgi:hypothetical protein